MNACNVKAVGPTIHPSGRAEHVSALGVSTDKNMTATNVMVPVIVRFRKSVHSAEDPAPAVRDDALNAMGEGVVSAGSAMATK